MAKQLPGATALPKTPRAFDGRDEIVVEARALVNGIHWNFMALHRLIREEYGLVIEGDLDIPESLVQGLEQLPLAFVGFERVVELLSRLVVEVDPEMSAAERARACGSLA